MVRILLTIPFLLGIANGAAAQSLFILQGERAAEGSVAWSVGPFSNGFETHVGASLDGRWDVGFGINRYSVDLGGPDDTTLTEYTPFVRYFLIKETEDAAPVSIASHAQYFRDHYDGGDEGWYVLAGLEMYKKFVIGDGLSVYPYVSFSFAAESFSFAGSAAEGSLYITRQLGVHGQIALGDRAWLRVTAEEQGFRRETYRAARVAYVRRF